MPSQHGSSPPLLKATSSLPVDERARDRFKARISRDWCTQQYVYPMPPTAIFSLQEQH
ncbi:uncharacterized protein BDV17DRAFT_262159 [Aspergillus undulatus]|uniref:uncharacterized protein n=1 Tax=Aspergillus undulatus TaxID=1810928 RepID=UPI003CCD9F4E